MKNSKNIPFKPLILALTSLAISLSTQHVHAISVDLGSLPLNGSTLVVATSVHQNSDFAPTSSTDGILGGIGVINGYAPHKSGLGSPQSIDWTWFNSPTPTLSDGQSVDYYTYTINLHFGWNERFTLKSYTLSTSGPDSSAYTLVTNYESLSSANDYSITNNAGTINTGEPTRDASSFPFTNSDPIETQTLIFKSSSIINSLRINTGPNPGWGDGLDEHMYILSEITGSATAEVVPEPSSYALLAGFFALGLNILLKTKHISSRYRN